MLPDDIPEDVFKEILNKSIEDLEEELQNCETDEEFEECSTMLDKLKYARETGDTSEIKIKVMKVGPMNPLVGNPQN